MSASLRTDGSLWIEEYSLADLVLAVQAAVQDGYEVSLTNANYPQGFSGHFTVGLVKVAPTVEPTAKPAPKAKAKAAPTATT